LFFVRTVTKAIPAAKAPKAKAITTDLTIIKTTAVETEVEIPTRIESFIDATTAKEALQ
jgi:hypothetical protein